MTKYEQALEKVRKELLEYRENILSENLKSIYLHSYETTIKEEVYAVFSKFSNDDFTDNELDAVLNTDSFISEVCETFYEDSQNLNDMKDIIIKTINELNNK